MFAVLYFLVVLLKQLVGHFLETGPSPGLGLDTQWGNALRNLTIQQAG